MGPIEPKQAFNDYVGAFQLNPINEVEEPAITSPKIGFNNH